MKTITFICAFNEEASIAAVIDDLNCHIPDSEVILINDGSTDETARIARAAGAEVISFPENRGLEIAIAEGYRIAFERGYDICCRIDGDGQHQASDLGAMIDLIKNQAADVVIGSRFLEGAESYTPRAERLVGTSILRALMRMRLGKSITDSTSGMYAANRFAMRLLAIPYQVGSPEVQGLLRLSDAELVILEVPVRMRERAAGQSSFVGRRAVHLVVTVAGALLLGEAFRRRRRQR